LAFHSESWVSGNNWTLTDATNVTGATSAPNGNATANALSPTAASGSHFVFSNGTTTVSYTSGTIYTQSAFFKAGTGAAGQFVQLTFSSARFTQTGYANFDLIAGTVSVVSGSSADANRAARIENYGDGWYRCIFTATCNSTGTGAGLIIALITSTGSSRIPSFSGVTGDVLYGSGAQVETGSVATTYIPTTTGAGSRAADVISASGALVSGLIGQTEGTIYAEVDLRNWIASGRILTCSNGTSNERIIIQVGANRTLQAIVTTASADVVDISTASGQVNGVYKCALTYASGDFAFYVNGTQIGTDSSGGVPASTSVFLGKIETSASTNFLNDRIRAAALYTTRLSNAQLAELTRL
jgi:molybdopterin-binding protein